LRFSIGFRGLASSGESFEEYLWLGVAVNVGGGFDTGMKLVPLA